MNEAGKAMIVMLPAGQYRSELVQPGEQALDLPMPFVAPQDTTILRCGFRPVASVRCDQLDTVGRELVTERITVAGTIPDKSLGESKGDGFIDDRFDKGDFMWASRSRVHGEWTTCSIRNGHELRTFAAPGLSHFSPPFFATKNVPSTKWSAVSIRL